MYIDALYEKSKDLVRVVERVNGTRVYKDYPAEYSFYYKDSKGNYTSIFGEKLDRLQVPTSKAFEKEKRLYAHKRLYESDIKPVAKCLEKNYLNAESPKLHVCFFDIETDFHSGDASKGIEGMGFAPTDNPFNAITAISMYMGWLDQMITLCIKPKTLTFDQAQEICSKFDNTLLCNDEAEMLENFLALIEDVDVFSGWNSEGFDIPYIVNRIVRVLGKDYTRKFCLWDQYPREREVEKYGKKSITYDFIGRVHLDYLELYRKYTYEERHSYSLDAIGEHELNERKVDYEGTLDQLYNNDFYTFIKYNRQDTALLHKLDAKLQFMTLANMMAHSNTSVLSAVMGTVAISDQAIVNEAHSRGMIVMDRNRNPEETQAAGAYVANPRIGLHDWIGSMDLNSLYPSVIRAGNMSTETIIGQIRLDQTKAMIAQGLSEKKSFAECWEGKFATIEYDAVMSRDISIDLTIDWNDGNSEVMSAAQVYDMIFLSGQNIILSANGTIFDNSKLGVIPGLLARWYSERKVLQKIAKSTMDIADGIEISVEFEQELLKLIGE